MKKTLIASVAVLSTMALAPAPVLAGDITNLVPASTLRNYCADRPANTEFQVQLTRDNGSLITGTVKCPGRASILSSYDDDDDDRYDNDDHDDDDDDDDDDHKDDDDRYDNDRYDNDRHDDDDHDDD